MFGIEPRIWIKNIDTHWVHNLLSFVAFLQFIEMVVFEMIDSYE